MRVCAGVAMSSPIISPRLTRLLEILLASDQPVRVDDLASSLGSSRRTVFRELESIDKLLEPYGLRLASIPRKGIALAGDDRDRDIFAQSLRTNATFQRNKHERGVCLLIELLNAAGIQKLAYYADILKVSEATVSNDFDDIEPVLAEHGISLVRKPGLGVTIEGDESAIRITLVSQLIEFSLFDGTYAQRFGYPSMEIEQHIREVWEHAFAPSMNWMTSESEEMMRIFLMVAVDRLLNGHQLATEGPIVKGFSRPLAELVADELEAYFPIIFSQRERNALAFQLTTSRSKQRDPIKIGEAGPDLKLQSIVFQMIERFDHTNSPRLKLDEMLVQGLTLHLWAALPRLEQRMYLPDPLEGKLAELYPDVYEKTREAVSVLEEQRHVVIPDSEISFIAAHFCASLANVEEQDSRKRVLRTGVVCAAGVGVSYMIASQMRKRYRGELEIVICDWNDCPSWNSCDILVSSVPLENTDWPVVQVNALLTDEDYRKIREAISTYAFSPRRSRSVTIGGGLSIPTKLDEMISLLQHAKGLLDNFKAVSVDSDCTVEDLAKFAGYRFGAQPTSGNTIYLDLMKREAISTQVVPELKIVLLHARTKGVELPVLSLLLPQSGTFIQSELQGAKSCLLALVPEKSPNGIQKIIGMLSGSLIDDPQFLLAVQQGDKAVVLEHLESAIMEYLDTYCKEKIKPKE